ncbi:recombinase family protein [Streptosporangium sp. NPDC000396]|uniref:recombinase family protein n=1 Tax=Streptosporangium sp. NPDC000396 TaxID=3366185 RepID=UPI0036B767C1
MTGPPVFSASPYRSEWRHATEVDPTYLLYETTREGDRREERNPRRLRPLLHRRARRHHPGRAAPGLGVPESRIYIDRGFSGTTRRNRAGLDQALAAVWDGTVFTVITFDRFARNMAEANETLTGLSGRGVLFGLGGSVYDWTDPFGRLFL